VWSSTTSSSSCDSLESRNACRWTGEAVTCMMMNLPQRCTRDMLAQTLDRHGFWGKYDFLYLPKDFRTGRNLGHAIVNLVSHADALRLRDCFDGFKEWEPCHKKVCEIRLDAVLQGLRANVDRYRNSPLMHESVPDDFKPILFEKGRRTSFPAPTRHVRAPRGFWTRRLK
jgi:hypothetical protein